jgi:hypothetical protein
MLLYETIKNSGNFELRKGIVKNLIFWVEMSIERFLPIFAYRCKGREVDYDLVFYHPKNLR